MIEKEYALIVAGGKGTRFSSPLPKQFLELNGKPVILHTLEAFYHYSDHIEVVLVLPENDLVTWTDICKKHYFKKPLVIQTGGATRAQSVRNGLEMVGDGLVAIHDGVRPLVSAEIIERSFRLAGVHGSAVAAVALKDSLRVMEDVQSEKEPVLSNTRAVDRSRFRIIQTPQTFRTSLIKQAYALPEDATLTDDASVFERAGFPVYLFEGSYRNVKVTTPEDLLVAQAFLNERRSS